MTRHVSFIIRIIFVLDLIRIKMTRGDINAPTTTIFQGLATLLSVAGHQNLKLKMPLLQVTLFNVKKF